ncbi:MAG: hypothetical protein AAF702_39910 [Chloroflexota bacterium]
MANNSARLRVAQRATYRIQIQGFLDDSWADHFGGLAITSAPSTAQESMTIITGQVLDQMMLLGILNRLCDLGLPIRSVEWLADQ